MVEPSSSATFVSKSRPQRNPLWEGCTTDEAHCSNMLQMSNSIALWEVLPEVSGRNQVLRQGPMILLPRFSGGLRG